MANNQTISLLTRHNAFRNEPVPTDFSQHVIEVKDFVTKDNKLQIEVVDKVDEFLEIQSHKDECGLEFIVKQLIAQGTPLNVLAKDSPEIDISELPEYIGEVFEVAENGKAAKADLDKLAGVLGISSEQLLEEVNKGTINNVISKYLENSKPKEEVKEDGK